MIYYGRTGTFNSGEAERTVTDAAAPTKTYFMFSHDATGWGDSLHSGRIVLTRLHNDANNQIWICDGSLFSGSASAPYRRYNLIGGGWVNMGSLVLDRLYFGKEDSETYTFDHGGFHVHWEY